MNKIKTILDFLNKKYGNDINLSPLRNQEIFELLVETILSQRTKDENSEKAANQLFSIARTPKQISELPVKKLQSLIRISGPYRQKTKRIKQVSKIIFEKYKGKVPVNREELMELPGVGYKTSAIVLMYGFGIPAIAVDVHVEQISKRLGLVSQSDKPQEIEKRLEKIFPMNKWYIINLGLVMFGKEICKPIRPLCIKSSKNCPFSSFCRAYRTKKFTVK